MPDIIINADGTVSPFGGVLLKSTAIPVLPDFRRYKEEVPGRAGEIDFGQDPATRAITLSILVVKPEVDKPAFLRQVASWLNPANDEFLLKDERDMEKQLRVKCVKEVTYADKFNQLIFKIPLIGRPYYESRVEHSLSSFPGTATNYGSVDTPVRIKFNEGSIDPSVSINGVAVTYTGTIGAGEYVEVDTELKTARKYSGGSFINVLGNMNGNFPWLSPGSNSVSFSGTGSALISWRDRWL
jgi:phage-related protein